ncbi:hypothetical protein CkaCkLH20_02532 [Colletotrichum karsti]|uniref:2EXR domain-containing protein n=1 Tax=Colletotrichum karsti TaxID=1095194 RepID=A0A9P6LNX9_9PEZI|nr:uncharacterized protein CkaCkLH20_02532 [Colletotrichum karsti]KAF9879721.1 hypothetical protein CkaCkLH20_02532 [Colletotrichum karsti]
MEQLIDLTTAIAAAVSQQSKAIAALTELCAEQQPAAAQLRALSEAQTTMTKAMEIQAEIVKRQRMTILDSRGSSLPSPGGAFTRFTQLPPEIRKMIWEMALPGPRLFYLHRDSEDTVTVSPIQRPPPMRAACREAWSVTEGHGYFEFGFNATRTWGIWFNPTKDIVFTDYLDTPWEFPKIQNIGLHSDSFFSRGKCISQLELAMEGLTHCRKIVVITRPGYDEEYEQCSNLRFFSLQDDDLIWSTDYRPHIYEVQDNGVTWGSMKQGLTQLYHEEDTLRRLGIEEKDLPEIVGMEVLMTNKGSS